MECLFVIQNFFGLSVNRYCFLAQFKYINKRIAHIVRFNFTFQCLELKDVCSIMNIIRHFVISITFNLLYHNNSLDIKRFMFNIQTQYSIYPLYKLGNFMLNHFIFCQVGNGYAKNFNTFALIFELNCYNQPSNYTND